MTIGFSRLGQHMAVAASGIDLNEPLGASEAATLRAAVLEHLVLCIRGQSLAPAAYRDAMRIFGAPLPQTRAGAQHGDIAEIAILSSEDRDVLGDGGRIVVGAHWHTDDSFKA